MAVFVTNGESNIALAAIRSLGRGGVSVHSGSISTKAMAFHSKYCQKAVHYPSPRWEPSAFMDRMEDLVKNTEYEIVFPGDWDALPVLSENRKRLEPHTIVPLPSDRIVKQANSKDATVKVAKKHGIPSPKTYSILDENTLEDVKDKLTYPIVVKPYFGSGSGGLRYVNNEEELKQAYEAVSAERGPCVVQEFIPGKKYLFSGLFNRDGEARRICVFEMLRQYPVRGGPIAAARVVRPARVVDAGIRIMGALEWYGVASVDFMLDERDGMPKLVDVNPRFFGSMQIAIAAGADYPYLFYKMIKEGDVDENLDYRAGVKGRSVLIGDLRHLLATLRGSPVTHTWPHRFKTLIDYLSFWEYQADLVTSFDDPGPGLAEVRSIFHRKLST